MQSLTFKSRSSRSLPNASLPNVGSAAVVGATGGSVDVLRRDPANLGSSQLLAIRRFVTQYMVS